MSFGGHLGSRDFVKLGQVFIFFFLYKYTYLVQMGGREEGGREGGREGREGGMTVIHILRGMSNSNPGVPQYLNNNLT